jgi:superoxide dismutase, Fe-Mn family
LFHYFLLRIDMLRRNFLMTASAVSALSYLPKLACADSKYQNESPLQLPSLPWAQNALDPVISSQTIGFHHGKHHKSYFDNLAKLLPGTAFEKQSLPEIVKSSVNQKAIFNNAAQAWNHTFFWHSLAPKAGGKPGVALLNKINDSFGSFDKFRSDFLAASAGQFGSGWVWLVLDKDKNKLVIEKTSNAETPLTNPMRVPLAVVDVWEHAYYLDYQNRRADYAAAVLDKLFNWAFVEKNLS